MPTASAWELITIAVLLALLGTPALVLGGTALLGQPHYTIVLASAIITVVIITILMRRYSFHHSLQHASSLPFIAVIVLISALTAILASSYIALPDVDPYHWLKVYRQMINAPDHPLPQRPLFAALYFFLDTILPFQPVTIAKYVIPLLALLPVIPLWLVAQRLRYAADQWALLLVPLSSPALIVYTHMAAPQAALLILTFFFASCLMYAYVTRQMRWHYIAGATVALAILYHGLAVLLFAAWLTATALRSRYYPVLLALLLVVGALSIPYLSAYFPAATRDVRLNLSFPSSFTTIDGRPNGWPGPWGWTRYYAFYAGATAPVILAAGLIAAARRHAALSAVRSLASHPSTLTLTVCLILFFALAELLPRFFNIVVLPERAWLFVAQIAPVLLIPLLQHQKHKTLISCCLFTAAALNVGGAVYINSLKAHIFPDYAVRAAQWIDSSLPAGSLVLTAQGPDYIDAYAPVRFTALPPDFYCQHSADSAENLRRSLLSYLPSDADGSRYVLFIRTDRRHPYASRPWHMPLNTACDLPLLTNFPDVFLPVYSDANNAILWQITGN